MTSAIMMTYLTCNVCNRARSDFLHLDNLRHMFLDLNFGVCILSAPIILNDICAITIALHILC
jgi:hypothetical protein